MSSGSMGGGPTLKLSENVRRCGARFGRLRRWTCPGVVR
ncbi:hypothetical protein STRIP9103_05399 [Streptomyces ipomoeae 91-03]|uniref:Uncharacterized protein n=1 Tax=Streptomyces ipomoeae 91-03 TaxID=698759 RepID=L1L626_9ACTN|nr:hypothetical protein STRIP9103_05399 [Streptomyces ipomoeae 91-03]